MRGSVATSCARGVAGPDEVMVGVAGDLNATKGIRELLERSRMSSSTSGSSSWDDEVGGTSRRVRDAGVGGRVSVFADVADDEFLAWLSAFDILVNLRYPHRGESSGSARAGPPGGNAHDRERRRDVPRGPRRRRVRIGPGRPDPEELADVIDRLAGDPEGRAAIRGRAGAYARDALAPTTTAAVYLEAIDDLVALRADPVRNAIARWARGLRPAGLGPRHVARGLGVRYPEALFELRGEEPG